MTAPGADRRGAPVPLMPYLAAPLAALAQGAAMALLAGEARFPWRGEFAAEGRRIGRELAASHDDIALGPELAADGLARIGTMLEGIEAWQRHPFRRPQPDRPVLAEFGATRLIDFRPAGGRAVLVVPSLVNPAHILDLLPERSLLGYLAGQGLRPVLLDWGEPDRESRDFDLGGYIARIGAALDHLTDTGPPALAGYCLGGTLAVAAAAERPDRVARLALIGAPWDFAGAGGLKAAAIRVTAAMDAARLAEVIETAGAIFGAVPAPWVQEVFAQLDPLQAARKFRAFARRAGGLDERLFVATEDWLNSGPALAAPAARELLVDLQFANLSGRGRWRGVDPARIACPALVVAATRDRITPPAAAEPLARLIPGARLHRPAAGHVGMIIGGRAEAQLWSPLAAFLSGREGGG